MGTLIRLRTRHMDHTLIIKYDDLAKSNESIDTLVFDGLTFTLPTVQ